MRTATIRDRKRTPPHPSLEQSTLLEGADTDFGRELGNLMAENHGLVVDRASHPRLVILTERLVTHSRVSLTSTVPTACRK
jgi:hypothetical protein